MPDPSSPSRRHRASRYTVMAIITIIAVSASLYVGAFAAQFQLTGYPVRNDTGWLGPPLTRNPQVHDTGKIYYYTSTDLTPYQTYRPLCAIWLALHGL